MAKQTKAEIAAKCAEYYAAHREAIAARKKARNAANGEVISAEKKAYYAANREEIKAKRRGRYQPSTKKPLTREEIAAKQKTYNAAHREEIAAQGKIYAETHRAELAAQKKVYAETHREEIAAYQKAYSAANAQRRRNLVANRRARKLGNGGKYTVTEWRALCGWFGNICLKCGSDGKLTADHVIPISKGGANTIINLQPLCVSCNSSKHTKTIDYRDPATLAAFLESFNGTLDTRIGGKAARKVAKTKLVRRAAGK